MASVPDRVFGLAAGVEIQQLANGVVVGNVRGPAVGRGNGGIERSGRVGEPLRTVVVEVRQRALPERLRGILIAGDGTPWVSRNRLIHPLDPFWRIEPPVPQLHEPPGGRANGYRPRAGRVARRLVQASLAVSEVKNDDQGNTRLTKGGKRGETARDDVSSALVLAAGALSRTPSRPRHVYLGSV